MEPADVVCSADGVFRAIDSEQYAMSSAERHCGRLRLRGSADDGDRHRNAMDDLVGDRAQYKAFPLTQSAAAHRDLIHALGLRDVCNDIGRIANLTDQSV